MPRTIANVLASLRAVRERPLRGKAPDRLCKSEKI